MNRNIESKSESSMKNRLSILPKSLFIAETSNFIKFKL